jgi:hypothetical protein
MDHANGYLSVAPPFLQPPFYARMRRFVLAMLSLASLFALSACSVLDSSPTYRYRLSVEVDTPDGLKSGSSVIEVDTRAGSNLRIKVKGEAVAVDLPDGQMLFVLLRSDRNIGWAGQVMINLVSAWDGEGGPAGKIRAISEYRELIEVPRYFGKEFGKPISAYPMLVTFEDLAEPTSVMRVDPYDLATSFGEGVSLKRITVQVTDDPVTTGIEERLGWAEKLWPNKLNGDRFEDFDKPELAARLSPNSFSTEIGQ